MFAMCGGSLDGTPADKKKKVRIKPVRYITPFKNYTKQPLKGIKKKQTKQSKVCEMEAFTLAPEQEYDAAVTQSLDVQITTHVRVSGLERIHPSVLEKDLEAIKRCGTLRDATLSLEQVTERWRNLGLFKDVKYYFQPTDDGERTDICAQIDVQELPSTKSIGIMTTDSAYPEVNVSLDNILGGRYTIKASYISPASRMHAVTASVVSNVPYLGTSAEYSAGHHTEKKYCQLASAEKVLEVKAVARNIKGPLQSEVTVGFQRRRLIPVHKKDILGDDMMDFSPTHKGYIRHDLSVSKVMYHGHQTLFNMYPLPIAGYVWHMANEVAGGVLGGDFSFLKSEFQWSKFWSLGPFFSLHWSSRLAGIVTDGHSRVPLNDRLFLANSHVRGFKSVGPSTLDRLTTATRFAATGGNALWASSLSLSFPFVGFPQNGFAAMHIFANAGNLRMVHSAAQLTDCWKWMREAACSVGAGIVVTRIPLMGVLPSGRFEVNFSVPIGISSRGDLKTSNGPRELFERVKFGLVWSSETTL
eukprot:gene453-236_t